MAYTRTLAQLRTSLLVRGGYEGSDDVTPAVALEVINDALEDTYNISIACDDDYYVKLGAQFATVAGQDTYAVPGDFYNLRKVEILDGTRWKKLDPVPLDGANLVQSSGMPTKRYRYRLSNAGLTLYPTPVSAADQLRIYYVPLAPQLAIDTDSVTFDRPVEQKLVLALGMLDLLDRQNLPTVDMERKVDKLTKQLRTAADSHDDGEPFYLNARGPHGDDEGCY